MDEISSFPKQVDNQSFEAYLFLILITVGGPLTHATLVIQVFDEPRFDRVFRKEQ